jgi:hypothetical protein
MFYLYEFCLKNIICLQFSHYQAPLQSLGLYLLITSRVKITLNSHESSVSGPYSAIDSYVKPFSPPDPPQMTALYELLSY